MKRGARITLTISTQAEEALDALLSTGLHGFNRADVARRLLDEALRERAEHGWIHIGPGRRKR